MTGNVNFFTNQILQGVPVKQTNEVALPWSSFFINSFSNLPVKKC